MPAQYVKPYVQTNKSDYLDAEAIAEAVAGVDCGAVIVGLLKSKEERTRLDVGDHAKTSFFELSPAICRFQSTDFPGKRRNEPRPQWRHRASAERSSGNHDPSREPGEVIVQGVLRPG